METETQNPGQDARAQSVTSSLSEKTLKAAGWSLIAGDAALVYAKHLEGDKNGFKGVGLWLGGGLAAALFGNPGAEKKLQLMERRLGAYLKKQNVTIPDNPTTADLAKDGGAVGHVESFLYGHPSELLNAAFAIGGALVLKGGFDQKSFAKKASGALVTAGALAGLLIHEKKPDPAHPAKGFAAKAWQWAQEKPLRISSALYMLNDIPVFMEAEKQRKAGSKSYLARYVTVATYVLGNVMLWLSSKENLGAKDQHKNQAMMESLADASAQVVAAQPKEAQEALVQHIAGYLSAQPEIKKTAPEIAQMLHEKLAKAREAQPAAGRWQQRVGPGAESSLAPSL